MRDLLGLVGPCAGEGGMYGLAGRSGMKSEELLLSASISEERDMADAVQKFAGFNSGYVSAVAEDLCMKQSTMCLLLGHNGIHTSF